MKLARILFAFTVTCLSASALKAESLNIGTYDHLKSLDQIFRLKDFASEALKKENFDVTFHSTPVLRSAELVQKGTLDGIFPCSSDIPKIFPDVILIEPPILYTHLIAVSLKEDKAFSVANLEKMRGTSILNNLGVQDFAQKRNLKILEVAQPQQAFELLEKKRVEFILLSQDVALAFLELHPNLKDKIQLNPEILVEAAQYFAISKKKSHLAPKIKKALKQALHENLKKYPHLKDIANKNF
ncbi:substrate-binding periplasmic protein [Bdellovibrio sp. HCB337]|uniref:substrate-binding periplasmic protein n=1 Tax=Bdellovibrio sp. HCB337 TaxID=3394358 RepID=UPI0039A77C58